MEWTPRQIAGALILLTAAVNGGIVYWLFAGDPLLLGIGAAVIVLGSAGGYLSLSSSLAEELGE